MKKKKGSTLIAVVAVFAILFTVGTAVLALTVSDYKMRNVESKRIENLYESESGIDIAYSILYKGVEQAVKSGNKAVSTYLNGDASDPSVSTLSKDIEIEKNHIANGEDCLYRRSDDPKKSILLANDNTIDENGVKTVLNSKFQNGVNGIKGFKGVIAPTDASEYGILNAIRNKKNIILSSDYKSIQTQDITGFNTKYNPTFDESELSFNSTTGKYDVKVVSSYFLNESGTSTKKREVVAKYNISVPSYGYGLTSSNTRIDVYPEMQNIFTADGDLKIDSIGSVSINGNILIKGNEPQIYQSSIAYDKYKNGIKINNAKVDFHGSVATSQTLNPVDNSLVNVTGNFYGNNIYMGGDNGASSGGSTLEIRGKTVLDNDLTINSGKAASTHSSITLDNGLFAISDINEKDSSIPTGKVNKEKSSSSIIINNDTTTTLYVNGPTYIMGTAYINTTGKNGAYQTGESVAVNGNYKAYNTILPGEEAKYFLNYYQPLQLIDNIDKSVYENILVTDKSAHFYSYSQNTAYSGNLNITNQLTFASKVVSIGAYINSFNNNGKGKVFPSNYNATDDYGIVQNNQIEFARNVYEMGDFGTDNPNAAYNKGVASKTVGNQIKFPTGSPYDQVQTFVKNGKKLIINSDPSKTIYLIGNNGTVPSDYNSSTAYRLSTNDSANFNGIIISAGDVYLSGNVTYNGTIITQKSIIAHGGGRNDGSNLNINYDANVVQSVVVDNNSILQTIFSGGSSVSSQLVNNPSSVVDTGNSDVIDINGLIKKGVWSISK